MAGTMYLPIWQQQLYAIANEESWHGSIEAPTGAFVNITLSESEHNLLSVAADQEIDRFWLVYEDDQGFLSFVGYGSEADLIAATDDMRRTFEAFEGE